MAILEYNKENLQNILVFGTETLEWDILNPDQLINLELNNKW